jgi:hypothetical protein
MAALQLRLPHLEGLRRQIIHREHAGCGVLGQKRRNGLRHETRDRLDPGGLLGIAFDRRPPIGSYPQLR